jgi:hypothetical protein
VRVLPVALIVMVAVSACTPTGGSSSAPSSTEAIGVREVTAPPVRLTPFCQAMLELDEELPDDPTVDTTEQVLTAYRAALPVVPAEIDEEFRAVIAALESGTRATVPGGPTGSTDAAVPPPAVPPAPGSAVGPTTVPSEEQLYAEEGWLPDDDPAARVNAYIDFACRGTANNPGPPATAPDVAPPTSTG